MQTSDNLVNPVSSGDKIPIWYLKARVGSTSVNMEREFQWVTVRAKLINQANSFIGKYQEDGKRRGRFRVSDLKQYRRCWMGVAAGAVYG